MRRAFNDLAGFVTGLGALPRLPHRHGALGALRPALPRRAIGPVALRESPWDAVVGCALIARSRASGSPGGRGSISARSRSRCSTSSCRACSCVLGLAFLLSPETLVDGLGFASGQDWGDLAFALPLAMLAYTGLETVANLAEEATEPGRTLPRSLFSAIGLVVVVTVLIGAIGLSAYPVVERRDGARRGVARGAARRHRGGVRRLAPDAPRRRARGRGRDLGRADPRRRRDDVVLGDHAADVLARRARLAAARVRAARAPRVVSSEAIAIAAALAIGLIVLTEVAADGDPAFLASLYSFGVLIAFTAAQLAVIRLRMREPDLARPFVARPNVTIRGHRSRSPRSSARRSRSRSGCSR